MPLSTRKHLTVFYADDLTFTAISNAVHGIGALGDSTLMPQMPFLESMAAQGVTFDSFRASPVCSTGRATIHTGCHPGGPNGHGVNHVLKPPYCGGLAEIGDPGFAAAKLFPTLDAAGIATSVVGKFHLVLAAEDVIPAGPRAGEHGSGWEGRSRVFPAGTHYALTLHNLNQNPNPGGQSYLGGYYNYFLCRSATGGQVEAVTDYNTSRLMAESLEFWNALSPLKRGCQLVCLNATHTPFGIQGNPDRDFPPLETVATQLYKDERANAPQSAWANYLAAAEAVDYLLFLWWAGLPPAVRRNMTVLVCSDNGPDGALLEAGAAIGKTYGAIDLARVKQSLYLHGTRVDAVLWGPGFGRGQVARWPADLVDIAPTLGQYFGAPMPPPIDGMSLLPLLDAGQYGPTARPEKRVLYQHLGLPLGRWEDAKDMRVQSGMAWLPAIGAKPAGFYHLLRYLGAPDEMYRLRDESGAWIDPHELTDLAPDSTWSQVVSAMHSRIDEVQP